MTDGRRFAVGDRVLVSRAEDGEGHEEATITDSYVLLIGGESRAMVVVDFADGERKWMTASEENVLPAAPDPADEDEHGDDSESPPDGNDGPDGDAVEDGVEGAGEFDAGEPDS